jgi:hypothetical protein
VLWLLLSFVEDGLFEARALPSNDIFTVKVQASFSRHEFLPIGMGARFFF